MDMATISAASTGLMFARDALQFTLKAKVELETQTRINEALTKLGTAHDTLFELREALARLQEENAELRRKQASLDEWETLKTRYVLRQTPGGSMVYACDGPPPHFACPVCFASKTIHVLQAVNDQHGTVHCPSCKNYYAGVGGSRQPHARRSVRDDNEW